MKLQVFAHPMKTSSSVPFTFYGYLFLHVAFLPVLVVFPYLEKNNLWSRIFSYKLSYQASFAIEVFLLYCLFPNAVFKFSSISFYQK